MNALTRSITVVLVLVLLVAATLRTTGLDYPVYLAEFLDPVDSLSSKEVGYVALITLVGHVARGNPIVRHVHAGEALVVVTGAA